MTIRNLLIVVYAMIALLGCGGSSHQSKAATPSLKPFLGSWSGPYGLAGQASEGTVTITVAESDPASEESLSIAGTAVDNARGSATVSGSLAVANGLSTYVLFQYPDSSQAGFSVDAKIDAQGHLALTPTAGSSPIDNKRYEVFDLAPIAATGQSRR